MKFTLGMIVTPQNSQKTAMPKKLVHNTKTSLKEEAKEFYPKVKEFYPNLDEILLDRISKYCVVYSEGKDDENIRKAIQRFSTVFEEELT